MELIQVYAAEGQLEAEMIKAFLKAQGIEAILAQESVGKTLGLSAGRLGQVKILVPENEVNEAFTLLQAMENGDYENMELSDNLDDE